MVLSINTAAVPVDQRFKLRTRYSCDNDCALCLNSMKDGMVIVLPCAHTYHEKCHAHLREAAAAYRYRCPICRKDYKRQIQRLKMYDIWGDLLWGRYTQYLRGLDGGPAPWKNASAKRERETFETWLINGFSEEEVEAVYESEMQAAVTGGDETGGDETDGDETDGDETDGDETDGDEIDDDETDDESQPDSP